MPADIDFIADYWTNASGAFLQAIGVDRARLGNRTDIIGRMRQTIPCNNAEQERLGFGIVLDGLLVGYTNINFHSPRHSVSHWHVIAPGSRNSGISTILYPFRLRTYFDCLPIEILIHQTRTTNIAMNRVLDKFVPVRETCFLEHPDGLAAPGLFNLRYVSKNEVARILATY